jgi:hypothetical protein
MPLPMQALCTAWSKIRRTVSGNPGVLNCASHFERILYGKSQLTRVYLHAWQVTGNEFFRTITEEILDYVMRNMLDPGGYSASAQPVTREHWEPATWPPGSYHDWTLTNWQTTAFVAYQSLSAVQVKYESPRSPIFSLYRGAVHEWELQFKRLYMGPHYRRMTAFAWRIGARGSPLLLLVNCIQSKMEFPLSRIPHALPLNTKI